LASAASIGPAVSDEATIVAEPVPACAASERECRLTGASSEPRDHRRERVEHMLFGVFEHIARQLAGHGIRHEPAESRASQVRESLRTPDRERSPSRRDSTNRGERMRRLTTAVR
jgi:hypothetical protein